MAFLMAVLLAGFDGAGKSGPSTAHGVSYGATDCARTVEEAANKDKRMLVGDMMMGGSQKARIVMDLCWKLKIVLEGGIYVQAVLF